MSEYELENGYILTDEEIARRAAEWESGTWSGHLVTLKAGRPRLSGEPNKNLSFKCPESGADMIALAAKMAGIKKSELIREGALEKAAEILAAAR